MHSITHFVGSHLTEKSLLLDKLNAVILPQLPVASHKHIKAANYSNQVLILIVDSPVWAARLRTQHKVIISSLAKELSLPISSIQIKFEQPITPAPKLLKRKATLSDESAKLIRQTANTITDEELKASLLRLSENSNQ